MTKEIHVLYVDDEPVLLEIVKAFLEKSNNFMVTTCESPIPVLNSLSDQKYDVIISDYLMPDMDGIEFLKRVRGMGSTIPFILFTGKGREEVVIQALNEGADFYLQKGGDPRSQFAELSHQIRQAVKQRRLEASIRDYERREADIINFLPDPTFAINSGGIVIAWNRAMEMLTGMKTREIVGKGDHEYALPFYMERRPMLIDLVLKDDPDISARYSSIRREKDLISSEITIPNFQGGFDATFWFTASPLYDNQGVIVGAIESIRDVTEIKRVQLTLLRKNEELHAAYEEITASDEELRKNLEKNSIQSKELEKREHQLYAMTSHISAVIFQFEVNPDETTGFTYISDRSLEILGIESNPSLFSEEFTNHIIPKERERFLRSIEDAIGSNKQWRFEGRYQKPSGEEIWLRIISNPIIEDDKLFFDGIIFDETEKHLKNEYIRLLSRITDELPALIIVHDINGTILYANEQTLRLHGYSREEFMALNLYEIVLLENEQFVGERYHQVSRGEISEIDVRHFRKDGSTIPLHICMNVIDWEGREVLLSIATDLLEPV